jgi:hypothetical protein
MRLRLPPGEPPALPAPHRLLHLRLPEVPAEAMVAAMEEIPVSDDYELPEDFVARLPRRTAHAVYALAAYARDKHCSGPFYAHEIVFWDIEAPSARSTGAALGHALKLGLADKVGNLWWSTNRGNSLFRHLEARVLAEQEEDRL